MKKKFISKKDIAKLSENDEYYSLQRWRYYEEVIDVLKKMNMEDISSILEIGPYKTPIVEESDVLDIYDFSEFFPIKINNVIKHDCSKVPFPIENKKYDLIIACQTMEHFGIHDEQIIAFKEFSRIAKKAIISLPFKWFAPTLRNHHMIDERVIDSWTRPFAYFYESIEGTSSYPTNIRIYDFSKIYLQNLFFMLQERCSSKASAPAHCESFALCFPPAIAVSPASWRFAGTECAAQRWHVYRSGFPSPAVLFPKYESHQRTG